MNTLESHSTEFIPGTEELCAKFTIDDVSLPFVLHDIVRVDQEYTLGFWIKADASGSVTINEYSISVTTEWSRHVLTFTATDVDVKFLFTTVGTYYIYHPKLEIGNKASDWSLNPNDEETETEFKMSMTSKGVAFINGSDVPTRIDEDGLVSRNVTVEGELRQSEWVWKRRGNGNYGLQWKEVTS